ncbi:MAG: hypothetical protein JXR86_06370 [Spirochaetales bacterium]|nr:hypothetical protein [Spirochaetales bacterium]
MGNCYFCGTEIDEPVYRSSECTNCGKDLKICFNCEFYSEGSHWECRESISDAVMEKDKSNYCDFFRLSRTSREQQENKDAMDAFNKLFGD